MPNPLTGLTRIDSEDITDGSIDQSKLSPSAILPASVFTGVDTNLTEKNTFNVGVIGFKMAVNEGLIVHNLIDGVVDEFTTEGGIDTAENSNAIYDSTSDFYTNQQSGPVPSPTIQRTTFTSPGTYNIEPTIQTVNVLVVGGGGSGGGAGPSPTNAFGGGGGAGGLIYYPGYPVTPGGSIAVTVGAGGTGADNETGTSGADSSFGPLIGEGGGAGAAYNDGPAFEPAATGGSGGGPGNNPSSYNQTGEGDQTANHPIPISPAGTAASDQSPNLNLGGSYGNDSGTGSTYSGPSPGGSGNPGGGGGGGGAGEIGRNWPSSPYTPAPTPLSLGGTGGDGLLYNIADGSTYVGYAGGGEAGGYNTDAARQGGAQGTSTAFGAGLAGQEGTSSPSYDPWPQKPYFHTIGPPNQFDGMDGLANRGSGGGGAHNHGVQSGTGFGGNGGSGVVIVAEDTFLNSNTSMTLVSDTFTANSTPTIARIVVFAELPDGTSDFQVTATRDDSVYNAITLTDTGYVSGSSGTKIFTGSTPLTGTASPQVQMRWKITGTSLTGANKIHGVSLQWK